MKKTGKMLSALMAMVMAVTLILAGCGSGKGNTPPSSDGAASPAGGAASTADGGGQQEVKVIKIGSTVTADHPITMSEYYFEKLFEERTNGAYDVQVFENMQLGSPNEMFEAVQLGNLEMTDSGSMALSSFTDKFQFLSLASLFPSPEVAFAFADSDMAQELYDRISEECSIRPVAALENGYLTVINNKHEIHTPEDMKGLKVRVQESPIYIKMYELMGANPMPMAFNEVFTALQQKTIDANNTTAIIVDTGKYYEVTDYFSDLNPIYDMAFIFASQKWLDSLPEDVLEIYYECWAEAKAYQRETSKELTEESIKRLEGLTTVTYLTDEERAAFAECLKPQFQWFEENYDEPYLDQYLDKIEELEAEMNQ